eukprot:352550-Chlamydomonas_euryale.AAC.14
MPVPPQQAPRASRGWGARRTRPAAGATNMPVWPCHSSSERSTCHTCPPRTCTSRPVGQATGHGQWASLSKPCAFHAARATSARRQHDARPPPSLSSVLRPVPAEPRAEEQLTETIIRARNCPSSRPSAAPLEAAAPWELTPASTTANTANACSGCRGADGVHLDDGRHIAETARRSAAVKCCSCGAAAVGKGVA